MPCLLHTYLLHLSWINRDSFNISIENWVHPQQMHQNKTATDALFQRIQQKFYKNWHNQISVIICNIFVRIQIFSKSHTPYFWCIILKGGSCMKKNICEAKRRFTVYVREPWKRTLSVDVIKCRHSIFYHNNLLIFKKTGFSGVVTCGPKDGWPQVEARRERLRRLEQELEQEIQEERKLLAQQISKIRQTRTHLAHLKGLSLVRSHARSSAFRDNHFCITWLLTFYVSVEI